MGNGTHRSAAPIHSRPLGDSAFAVQVERHVVIEVPDFPMFWAYQQWLAEQPSHNLVGVTIVNQHDFITSRGQQAVRETIESLVSAGRPALFWVRVWGRSSATSRP